MFKQEFLYQGCNCIVQLSTLARLVLTINSYSASHDN